jgi:large subunit ribosomal protein L30
MARLRITQVRSASRREASQERTLRALGIRRNGRTVEHEATPQIRGMVAKIRHLVRVEEKA